MSGIDISGPLYKKKIVRNLNGEIIDLTDEFGDYIVRRKRIVNQDAWNDILQKEEDKRSSAQAISNQREVSPEILAQRNGEVPPPPVRVEEAKAEAQAEPKPAPSATQEPDRIDKLEKDVDELKGGISQILSLLQNK